MTDDGRYDEQRADAVKKRDALRAMLGGLGWEIVNEWLQQEIDTRRDAYELSSPHGMNDASIIGYQRAQLSMLRTLQDLPKMLFEVEQNAIDQMKDQDDGTEDQD